MHIIITLHAYIGYINNVNNYNTSIKHDNSQGNENKNNNTIIHNTVVIVTS